MTGCSCWMPLLPWNRTTFGSLRYLDMRCSSVSIFYSNVTYEIPAWAESEAMYATSSECLATLINLRSMQGHHVQTLRAFCCFATMLFCRGNRWPLFLAAAHPSRSAFIDKLLFPAPQPTYGKDSALLICLSFWKHRRPFPISCLVNRGSLSF